ncbi:AraC family transcriptional regulator [Paenibacillus sp. JJ-223]|uniref:AraC family transcriptional regulator n=1 Tax=Paenibacillus sp. JJ-223 TaxID=2905647 RepID=UPI001F268E13|nr:AraC family transcriptional regulator [Paenibacillus sp. JJ-223]CAH1203072.1 HTH-type transcriptional activator RhaS [Paenibacillus sp. JJ-223]
MNRKSHYLDLGLETDFIFRIEKCPLTHDFDVHHHDYSELVVILGGTATHIIEGREYPISAGQVFFIHGNVSHGYKDVDHIQYVNVMFHPDQMTQLQELKLMAGFQALFYFEPFYRKEMNFKGMLTLNDEQLRQVTGLLDVILSEHDQRPEGYRMLIRSYFTALMGVLSRYYVANNGWPQNKALRIAESITYLEEHFQEPLNLDMLAEKAYLSKRQFLREFARNFQTTPMDYVIRRRLDYSCALLRNPNLSILQVAQESGFRDQNYYARQFKKIYLCTPTEYREKYV